MGRTIFEDGPSAGSCGKSPIPGFAFPLPASSAGARSLPVPGTCDLTGCRPIPHRTTRHAHGDQRVESEYGTGSNYAAHESMAVPRLSPKDTALTLEAGCLRSARLRSKPSLRFESNRGSSSGRVPFSAARCAGGTTARATGAASLTGPPARNTRQ